MSKVKVRYLVAKRMKRGWIYYWQPNKALRAAGWLPRRVAERTNDILDAIAECEALNRKVDAWRAGTENLPAPPGSLPWLIKLYQADPRFTGLGEGSQRSYVKSLRRIEAWSERAGHPPIKSIERRDVKAYARSMDATPAQASHVMSMLRILFSFAIDEGELQTNPATAMRLKGPTPRHQVWTDEQIDAVIAKATAQGRPSIALAVALAHNLGQRQGDVLHMAWSQFDGTTIKLKQRKTGTALHVPCTKHLLAVLAAAPRTGTLMVMREETMGHRPDGWHRTFAARPYKAGTFSTEFRKIARAAGVPDDLEFRDLRRTAVVRLAEAGCSVPEIASISGHTIEKTTQIMEVYCPRTSTMAGHAITKLEDFKARRVNASATKLED